MARKEEPDYELPTSMIDVVFLLLIFFLVASKFKENEGSLAANLPTDEGQMPVPTELQKPEDVRVYLEVWPGEGGSRDVVIKVNNRLGEDIGGKTDGHAFVLLRQQLEHVKQADPETAVVIQAHKPVEFRHVVSALDAAKQAGIEEVKFQAPAVEGAGGSDYHHK
jgi:biopolymer transport protein ExbD